MISPFVRRRRLAAELVRLREEHNHSSEKLARAVGISRQRISRLENGHVAPDLDEIMKILSACPVGEKRWDHIMTIAREAQERGWWEKFTDEMGPRQALYANLEAGARLIREYHLTLIPGLLQIPAFTEARIRADRTVRTPHFDPDRALEARAVRQRMLQRPGGPRYEVILDELAIRRPAATLEILRAQLDHLIDVGHNNPRVSIQVLPLTASIAGHALPRSSFSCYQYPDPDDPVVVAVDTVTSDLILTTPTEVSHYLTLYERLHGAALTASDSLDVLIAQAENLTRTIGS